MLAKSAQHSQPYHRHNQKPEPEVVKLFHAQLKRA